MDQDLLIAVQALERLSQRVEEGRTGLAVYPASLPSLDEVAAMLADAVAIPAGTFGPMLPTADQAHANPQYVGPWMFGGTRMHPSARPEWDPATGEYFPVVPASWWRRG